MTTTTIEEQTTKRPKRPRRPKGKVRTNKYRIYLTRRQREQMTEFLRFASRLYNAALEQRRDIHRRNWRWQHRVKSTGKLKYEWYGWETGPDGVRRLKKGGNSIGYNEQSRMLTEARRELADAFPEGLPALVQHEVLQRLERAYSAFFQRVKEGDRAGPPRWRNERRYDSATWGLSHDNPEWVTEDGEIMPATMTSAAGQIRNGRLRLSGLGDMRVRWHRPIPDGAIVGTCNVRRGPGGRRFYAAISFETPPSVAAAKAPRPAKEKPAVGMDVGVFTWATLFSEDHEAIAACLADLKRNGIEASLDPDNPGALRIAAPRMGRRKHKSVKRGPATVRVHQRTEARRRKPGQASSNRRWQAVYDHHSAAEYSSRRMRDHQHKVSSILVRHFGLIAHESLDIQSMTRAPEHQESAKPARLIRRLNRQILSQAWYLLFTMIGYKAEDAGSQVVSVPRFEPTTQRCARCGELVPKSPLTRVHRCTCGHVAARTTNSAQNVYALGLGQSPRAITVGM